jgi:hypothetical protein
VSELSYFFDGEDKSYGSESYASMFQTVVANGVVKEFGNKLNPSFGTNMTILIDTGRAWIQGKYYENTASLSLTIPTASGTNPRYDLVVLRLDKTNRNISLVIKKGTPATSPTVPSLQQDSTIYELPICQYTVAAGATLPTTLVDKRQYNYLIGQVDSYGWNLIKATLTYVSPTTIATSSDLSGVIPKGAKLWINQGGNKYFYVIAITPTTITVLGDSSNPVINSTISASYWSNSDPVVGFPQSLNYTPTISAGSGSITSLGTVTFKFLITHQTLYFDESITIANSGSALTDIQSTLPANIGGGINLSAYGRETGTAGLMLVGLLSIADSKLKITKFDGTYMGNSGSTLLMSGHYPI